jgi:hypothetical protein
MAVLRGYDGKIGFQPHLGAADYEMCDNCEISDKGEW